MLPTKNQILLLFSLSVVLLFFFCITPASAHVEKGDMPDSVAEMEYRILLEFKPNNLDVRNKLGMILFRSEKYDEAAYELNYVLKKDPKNIDALTALALVKTKLLKYQQAITLLDKALAINPDDMHTYFYLGQTFEVQGDLSKAEELYKKGLSRKIPQTEQLDEDRKALVEALNNLQKRNVKISGANN